MGPADQNEDHQEWDEEKKLKLTQDLQTKGRPLFRSRLGVYLSLLPVFTHRRIIDMTVSGQ